VESGKVAGGAEASWSRTLGLLNPLRAVWWLFTNIRFAIVVLALLALVSLIGVVLPQKPAFVRGDSIAEGEWLETQEGRFGGLMTDVFDATELFDLFHASWFAALLGITVASTAAYVISRFPGIWRSITKPRKRVPDGYFDTAPEQVSAAPMDAGRLESALRKSRYVVDRFDEPGATYLFADRFAWAQLGTLFTHVAVVVFIAAAVFSRIDSFENGLFLAEGATLPVFPVANANQIQVELVDTHGEFTEDGRPLDYYSEMVIYDRGEEVERCTSTVNSPCKHEGYYFYQAAYFGFGAALQVREIETGNVVYRETLALSETAPSPHVIVREESGATVLDESLVLTDPVVTEDLRYVGTLVELPDGRVLTMGLREDTGDPKLIVLEAGGEDAAQLVLAEGESGTSGGLEVEYVSREALPLGVVPDLPLPESASGGSGEAVLQMTNVVYGTDEASAGTDVETPADSGPPELTISGLQPRALTLAPGESATIDGLEYTFLGQREFAGINVRRDRSDYLIWIGAALTVVGLMVTFWVPRRRLWARITDGETRLAGQAPKHARYSRELEGLLVGAGAGRAQRAKDD
jgi:cytochrome c biogenesis protein ResB